jgi:hypothetical protein
MSGIETPSPSDLIGLCRNALALRESGETEAFLERTGIYLEAFGRFQAAFDVEAARGSDEIKRLLEELNSLHITLIACAKEFSQEVLNRLGDTHARAKAVRTYLDRYPSRITIAGKREG